MQLQRHFKIGEKIRAIKNAVMKLHVEKLDGEDVGRLAQLIVSKYEWGKVSLLNPPFRSSVQVFQGGGVGSFYNAKNVQVRMSGAEFTSDRGAVEHHGF